MMVLSSPRSQSCNVTFDFCTICKHSAHTGSVVDSFDVVAIKFTLSTYSKRIFKTGVCLVFRIVFVHRAFVLVNK